MDLLNRAVVRLTTSACLPLQYQGITQMQVEDDTSASRKGRKATIHVRPRPGPGPGPASELQLQVSFCSYLCSELLVEVKAPR